MNQTTADHRRSGRLRQKLLLCNLGQIVDLSATGMRIRTRSKPPAVDEQVEIVLTGLTMPTQVIARVVWTRRLGMLSGYEMGLALVNAEPAAVQYLAMIASSDIRHMPYPDTSEDEAA